MDLDNKILNLPSLFEKNKEGEIINIKTKTIVRDTYIVKVENFDNSCKLYSTILDCAKDLSINRNKITKLISGADKSFKENFIFKIKKIRVFNKIRN